ncbi:hypothetical protein BDV96DRAFT_56455 [Lophiotrema nucula]|uniref:Uncharacterized protein n=1 Tax=Lophiotrema nucula TaxID=690887 RepID=A0A6A5ZA44_9PLEO|nr:hypothetical protein BDV96DRAFT_56455 [Lophiotrema nucula]
MAGAFRYTDYPWRPRPAEYVKGHGWFQTGVKRRVKKPYHHWIWPKDGRRDGKWGRIKDILSNKGPDIHVSISADKMDYMHNRQRKSRWANHTNLDDRGPDGYLGDAPWARRGMDEAYDFHPYERRYRRPHRDMWTDAMWGAPGVKLQGFDYPHAYRNIFGEWAFWDSHALDNWS